MFPQATATITNDAIQYLKGIQSLGMSWPPLFLPGGLSSDEKVRARSEGGYERNERENMARKKER